MSVSEVGADRGLSAAAPPAGLGRSGDSVRRISGLYNSLCDDEIRHMASFLDMKGLGALSSVNRRHWVCTAQRLPNTAIGTVPKAAVDQSLTRFPNLTKLHITTRDDRNTHRELPADKHAIISDNHYPNKITELTFSNDYCIFVDENPFIVTLLNLSRNVSSLSLVDCSFGEFLMNILPTMPNLTELDLSESISAGYHSYPHYEKLKECAKLVKVGFPSEMSAEAVIDLISFNRKISHLHLNGNATNDLVCVAIAQHLKDIKHLKLSGTAEGLTIRGLQELATFNHLESFGVNEYGLKPEILMELQKFPVLSKVALRGTNCPKEVLKMLCSKPTINSLSLPLSRRSEEELCEIGKIKGLKFLDLSSNQVTQKVMEAILHGCRELEELNISDCNFSFALLFFIISRAPNLKILRCSKLEPFMIENQTIQAYINTTHPNLRIIEE